MKTILVNLALVLLLSLQPADEFDSCDPANDALADCETYQAPEEPEACDNDCDGGFACCEQEF